MGRASVNDNKTIYQLKREGCGLTREQAADLMPGLGADRLEKLENGRANLNPEDVMLMSKAYNAPELCNHYCANECEIGREYVSEIKPKELAQIAIEALNSLNKFNKEKDRFLEIVEDGEISEDEEDDFNEIKETLEKIYQITDSLKLWVRQKNME